MFGLWLNLGGLEPPGPIDGAAAGSRPTWTPVHVVGGPVTVKQLAAVKSVGELLASTRKPGGMTLLRHDPLLRCEESQTYVRLESTRDRSVSAELRFSHIGCGALRCDAARRRTAPQCR